MVIPPNYLHYIITLKNIRSKFLGGLMVKDWSSVSAVALARFLAKEPPSAVGMAKKIKKQNKQVNNNNNKKTIYREHRRRIVVMMKQIDSFPKRAEAPDRLWIAPFRSPMPVPCFIVTDQGEGRLRAWIRALRVRVTWGLCSKWLNEELTGGFPTCPSRSESARSQAEWDWLCLTPKVQGWVGRAHEGIWIFIPMPPCSLTFMPKA